jgi:restriction system protein
MFGKIIALMILGIAAYNIYRIYERGRIRAELIENGQTDITHEEVIYEQNKRDHERMIESMRKFEEQKKQRETIKKAEQVFYKQKKEFRPYTEEERKAYGAKKRELKQKGDDYEAFVAEYYRKLGYHVREHGKEMGKKDAGIDLIATNHKEAIMIQCKNWRAGSKYTINHESISSFVGKVEMFLKKNTEYQQYEIKRIFTVSEEILDKSALAIVNENREMVRYEHIPMP